MAATQILFIRHGETPWNRIKRIQGHTDIPLADTGVTQAAQLAARMAREAHAGAQLDALYSSDLMRARQTAAPIGEALGMPVQLSEGLRERHYGQFEGHDHGEIAERFPDAYAHWQTRDPAFVPEGGESQQMFYRRVVDALGTLLAAHPGGRIACVAHGGVLDCIYRHATGMALDVPRQYALLNTSLNVVEYAPQGAPRVLSWADVSHLETASDDDGFKKVL